MKLAVSWSQNYVLNYSKRCETVLKLFKTIDNYSKQCYTGIKPREQTMARPRKSNQTKKIIMAAYATPEYVAKVKSIADSKNITVSGLIIAALDEYFSKTDNPTPPITIATEQPITPPITIDEPVAHDEPAAASPEPNTEPIVYHDETEDDTPYYGEPDYEEDEDDFYDDSEYEY